MTTITHDELATRGFERSSWSDKDSPKDKLYISKFIEFKKQLVGDLNISICYGYRYSVTGNPVLFETTCELSMGSEYELISMDRIEELDQLINVLSKANLKDTLPVG